MDSTFAPAPSHLEINVTGTGYTVRKAERAILVLQATCEKKPTPAEASAAVTQTANILREAITPYCPQDGATGQTLPGAAISHYSMSTLDTSSYTNQREGSGRDGKGPIYDVTYSARADFHIKFADFDILDTLATKFSAMNNVRISRINWCLTDDTLASIKGGARKLAAQDAIQKACDYAAVFAGLEEEHMGKVKALEIKEDQYYSQSTRPQLHYGKAQRHSMTNTNKEELQFQPEDVRLEVKVNAKFVVEG